MTEAAITAKEIKKVLRHKFPGVKFRVTSENFSNGNSVRVQWTDGPDKSLVNKIVSGYKTLSYNIEADYWEYTAISMDKNCPGVNYIDTSRNYSPAFIEKIEILFEKYHHEKWDSTSELGRYYHSLPNWLSKHPEMWKHPLFKTI